MNKATEKAIERVGIVLGAFFAFLTASYMSLTAPADAPQPVTSVLVAVAALSVGVLVYSAFKKFA